MADVVLIQPKAGPFDMLGARLPIGLLSISAFLHKKGYKIKIIDQRLDERWEETLEMSLKKNPLCVGITCMTGKQIFYAIKASKLVRKYSKCPIVWGGVHASLLPDQTLSNNFIDMLVLGEGDITFTELVEAIKKGNSFEKIKGLYFKKGSEIIKNPTREFITELDSLPELPYELVDVDRYASMNVEGRSIDFVTSRGCPHRCSFCYNQFFNKRKWRAFSAEETVKRLKNVVTKYNIKTVYFQDDNFCVDLVRLKKILEGMIRENINVKWGTLGLRIDTAKKMDDELLSLMERSGCMNVDIGAESGNKRILEMIDKDISVEDLLEVNKRLAKYPFFIKYTFIIGFPTETKKETYSTVKVALQLTKDNPNACTPTGVYTPYPGTPMYNFAVKHGFKSPKNLEEWGKFSIDDWYFHFKSWMSHAKMRELKSIAFTSLFANDKLQFKINKPLTKLLFKIYHPIAKFRFKNNFHFLPIDSLVSRKILYDKI